MAAENVLIVKLEEESRPTQSTSAASPRPEPPAPPLPPQPPTAASDPTAFYPEYRELRNRADMGGGMSPSDRVRLDELELQLRQLANEPPPAPAAPKPEPETKSAGRQELELNPETAALLKKLWSGKITPEEFEKATMPQPAVSSPPPEPPNPPPAPPPPPAISSTALSVAGGAALAKMPAGLVIPPINRVPVGGPGGGFGGMLPPGWGTPQLAGPAAGGALMARTAAPIPVGEAAAGGAAAGASSLLGPLAIAAAAYYAVGKAGDAARAGLEEVGEAARGLAKNEVMPTVERGMVGFAKGLENVSPVLKAYSEAIQVAATGIRVFRETVNAFTDRARELAGYDSRIAGATANADVRKVNADLRESQRVGREYARLVDAQSRLETKMQDLLGPVKEFVVGRLVTILEAVELHVDAIQNISDDIRLVTSPIFGVAEEMSKKMDTLIQIGKNAFPAAGTALNAAERVGRRRDNVPTSSILDDIYESAFIGIQPGVTGVDANQQRFERDLNGRMR